jgi:hypothetical protein
MKRGVGECLGLQARARVPEGGNGGWMVGSASPQWRSLPRRTYLTLAERVLLLPRESPRGAEVGLRRWKFMRWLLRLGVLSSARQLL